MKIRTVTVELLRAGPRHNQLLSPLTQYLGVCGDAPAGIVTLPYEHRDIEQRLEELHYRVAGDDGARRQARRQELLHKTGSEIAEILSLVPGLAGVLNPQTERSDTLTHLRIVLSASELAMLPFELSKVPAGHPGLSSGWLALHARMPVCITRHIRSVSGEGVRWPTDPRILFIAGPDTPVREHRDALSRALAPWRDADGGAGDRLVVLEQATRASVESEVARAATAGRPFSHVHVLAHGEPLDDTDRYSPIGVALHDETLSGERLAMLFTPVTDAAVVRPAVVTLATCESGNVGDVRTVTASIAHDLHDRGIPLVVASQFPLTVRGSVPFVERFYDGQLRGEHPLLSLYDVRLLLHRQLGQQAHDWASIVVYEALPSDFADQLEDVRYWQARRMQDQALQRLERLVAEPARDLRASSASTTSEHAPAGKTRERYEQHVEEAGEAATRLPDSGPYALECAGLRAAGHKRIAQAAVEMAVRLTASDPWRDTLVADCLQGLDRARTDYWRATRAFLAPGSDPTRRKANLHWLLGQVLSLDAILGRPLDLAGWTAARMAALIDTEQPDEIGRAWAYVSLSEQALLRLADETLAPAEHARYAEESLAHALRIVECVGRESEHAMTTSRQFERYVSVWGNPAVEQLGLPPHAHWRREGGLVATATRVVEALRGRRRAAGSTRGSGSANGGGAPPSSAEPDGEGTATETAKTLSSSSTRARPRDGEPMFDIEMLQAENGDCLWIEYGDRQRPHRMLVDCGAASTSRVVAERIERSRGPLALFVLTHIDADHINGVLPLFASHAFDDRFGDIWFNGWRQLEHFLSVRQGEQFSALLGDRQRNLPWNRSMSAADARHPAPVVVAPDAPLPTYSLPDGMRLTLLSPGPKQLEALGLHWKEALRELEPDRPVLGRRKRPPPVTDFDAFDLQPLAAAPVRQDPSVANGSSIAFLAEFEGRRALLCGDAHADVLAQSIERLLRERGAQGGKLAVDAIKLSHHGSAHGTTPALLRLLDCPRYLVSSNGKHFYHPDREAVARVILHGGSEPELCFNYRTPLNALWDEPTLRTRYRYSTRYPAHGDVGLRVSL